MVGNPRTHLLWESFHQHPGDRHRLFGAVAAAFDVSTVFYPGCYVDVTPSFVFDSVTYLDVDRRAAQFFADVPGVEEIVRGHRRDQTTATWRFLHADYTAEDTVPEDSFDLLLSLYAGFVSEHCTRHLRTGGLLLVNPSHGDVAMARLEPRYRLVAVVTSRDGRYAVRRDDLETFLVPRRDIEITKEGLRASGRGIAYTRPAFAYVFQLGPKDPSGAPAPEAVGVQDRRGR